MTFLTDLLNWVLSGLATYGYLIVFLGAVLENLFVVGSFMPGDLVVAAAAFTASTPQGQALSPWVLLGLAILGAFVGANISFQVGLRAGRGFIERTGVRVGINAGMIEAAEMYFDRHGPLTIVFARLVAVVKNMAPALAGASRMNAWVFELYTLLGATVYASALVGIGLFLGANFQAGLKYLGGFSWAVFITVAIVGALLWRAKKKRDARLVARLDAEYVAEHEHPLGVLEAGGSDDDA